MKICLLTRHFDTRYGGIGRVSWELWQGLREQHQVTGVHTSGKSLASYLLYSLHSIRSHIPPDCEIYHALTPVESLWIPKDKAIVTFHDLFPVLHREKQGADVGESKIKQAIATKYFGYCARAAAKCHIIACNSELTKQGIVQYLGVPEDRIRVVRLGIPQLTPKPKVDNTFRIGYLGQLDRRKRVHLLIDAFKHSNLKAELLIGGTGNERVALKTLAGDDSRIQFLGYVPDGELNDFYCQLDLFIFPTAVEGYGLPIVEAMACKKPVVVLSDAVLPYEIKERCAIVKDFANLFNRLRYGYKHLDEVLKHYDGFGWEIEDNYRFAKEHSWEKTVSEYIELYKEMLDAQQPKE